MDTNYTYEVRAVNSKGTSVWSPILKVKTDLDPYRNVPNIHSIKATDKDGSAVQDQGGEEIKNAIDGEDSTTWHTKWQVEVAFPAEIVMDLGNAYALEKFEYTPRTDKGTNGLIKKGNIQFSQDGIHWTEKKEFEWATDSDLKTITTQDVYTRYIKLTVTQAVGGFISAGEFRSYKVDGTIGLPVGDTLASEGKLDKADFEEYKKLYAGIDKDSTLWKQVDRGDLNYNQYIDAFDVAYITRLLGLEAPSEEKVNGQITLEYPDGVTKNQVFEVKVMGTALNDVYAFDVAIPFDGTKVAVGEDKDDGSFWETSYSGEYNAAFPVRLDLDLGEVFTMDRFEYVPRGSANGSIEGLDIYYSTDNTDNTVWKKANTEVLSWDKNGVTTSVYTFDNDINARYIRLHIIKTGGNGGNVAGNELKPFVKPDTGAPEPPVDPSISYVPETTTMCETSYQAPYNNKFPIRIDLDLGASYTMDRFECVPRGGKNANGASLSWVADGDAIGTYTFDGDVKVRYIRLHVIKVGGGTNVAINELKPFVKPKDTSVVTPAAIEIKVTEESATTPVPALNEAFVGSAANFKQLSVEKTKDATINIGLDSETKFGGDYSMRVDYTFAATENQPSTNSPWETPKEEVTVTPDGEDWSKVTDEIKKAKEGSKVVVDATKNAQVTGAVLSAMQGKNIELVLKINETFTWSINGKNVEKDITGTDILDLKVAEINEKALTTAAAKQLGISKHNVMQFEISHNGTLPFTGKLSIFVGKDKVGKEIFLNYYDETKKAFEAKDKNIVDKDGNVALNFNHASRYSLTTESLAPVSVLVSKTIYKGSRYTLKPVNLADDATVTYTSSNKSMVTVTKSGTIKGIKVGKATITTVIAQDGGEYTFKTSVTVKKPSITLDKKKASLNIGEKFQFKAKLNGVTGTVTWSTSNKGIASITKNGTLKGIKAGSVTVKANVGAISVQYKVKIVK